jgi:hypothetical protein
MAGKKKPRTPAPRPATRDAKRKKTATPVAVEPEKVLQEVLPKR